MGKQKGQFYSCKSIIGKYCYITSNDPIYAKKLIDAGGLVLCHPDLFSVISNHQNEAERLVPFVIRLACTRRGSPDQDVPTDIYESALAKFY